jgi:hypothetical protein
MTNDLESNERHLNFNERLLMSTHNSPATSLPPLPYIYTSARPPQHRAKTPHAPCHLHLIPSLSPPTRHLNTIPSIPSLAPPISFAPSPYSPPCAQSLPWSTTDHIRAASAEVRAPSCVSWRARSGFGLTDAVLAIDMAWGSRGCTISRNGRAGARAGRSGCSPYSLNRVFW